MTLTLKVNGFVSKTSGCTLRCTATEGQDHTLTDTAHTRKHNACDAYLDGGHIKFDNECSNFEYSSHH